MVNVELTGEARGGVAVLNAQFAARAIAVGVHGSLGHPQFAGDLLGRKMLINKAQAFALSRCEQPHRLFRNDVSRDHRNGS